MISILMATFNGEEYIRAQLESLFAQTEQNFRLIISDDASTDSTISIIEEYQKRFPDRIVLTRRECNSGNAKHNYFDLMIEHKDDYIMLCDQDDVWLPQKITVTLKRMREMEQLYGVDLPLLVHTDLTLTNANLKVTYPSYREAMCSIFERTELKYALIQNTFAGCSCMYNRALADLLYAEPEYCVMHDWWLMLVAAAFGKIGYTYESTALYRQHKGNSIGARDMGALSYKLRRLLDHEAVRYAIDITYVQARNFLEMYRKRLSSSQIELIEAYCRIPQMSKFEKIRTLFCLGTLKNTLSRRVAHFLFV